MLAACGLLGCHRALLLLLSAATCNLATGYRVSGTHANPLGMKTDAPWDVIWDVMRAWVADHPVKKQVRCCSIMSGHFILHHCWCH